MREAHACKRITDRRVNWYEHVMRRDEEHTLRESDKNGYTREREGRTTENKMERRVPTILEKYFTELERAWRRKFNSHNGDTI